MPRKREARSKEYALSCQVEVADIALKLKSLGALLQWQESEDTPSLPGLGLILTDLSAQLDEISDRLDPVQAK